MNNKEDINYLIDSIIDVQSNKIQETNAFCCGKCNLNKKNNIIETDSIKIIFNDSGECEIRKKENKNPVIMRDKNKNIYRLHGEWIHIKKELYRLSGFNGMGKM